MKFSMKYTASEKCAEAMKFIADLHGDPMTAATGMGSEVQDEWLRKHIMTCEECRMETINASMP